MIIQKYFLLHNKSYITQEPEFLNKKSKMC